MIALLASLLYKMLIRPVTVGAKKKTESPRQVHVIDIKNIRDRAIADMIFCHMGLAESTILFTAVELEARRRR